ncbi:MAG: hypothetical protein K5884_10795 [Ruminococcus sp.]|nr:hypothetical protein [Ruminococcus sp.]
MAEWAGWSSLPLDSGEGEPPLPPFRELSSSKPIVCFRSQKQIHYCDEFNKQKACRI